MNEPIDWQARADEATEQLGIFARQIGDWKARAEKAERACAEMRDFFIYLKPQIEKDGIPEEIDSLNLVLSSDAGRNYYHRDEFKPLVEALALVIPDCCCERSMDWKDTGLTHGSNCPVSIVSKVLADARAKGLIE